MELSKGARNRSGEFVTYWKRRQGNSDRLEISVKAFPAATPLGFQEEEEEEEAVTLRCVEMRNRQRKCEYGNAREPGHVCLSVA